MGLRMYIVKRVIYSIILLFFVITLNFIIFMLMPGDPSSLFMPPPGNMPKEEYEKWRHEIEELYGLHEPIHIRFYKTLIRLLTWNFGKSLVTWRPVAAEMLEKLPWTLYLIGTSTIISIIIGVALGVLVAFKRGGKFDNIMVLTSIVTYSLPTFWIGMVFILIFSIHLGWFPSAHGLPTGWAINPPHPYSIEVSQASSGLSINLLLTSDTIVVIQGFLRHSFLPMLTLILFSYGGWILLTRAVMLESLTEDYIITARAKGVPERTVLFKHALKNASLPLITSAALSFGFILTGAIITEAVFTYPGLGRWVWGAIAQRNYAILMPIFYVIAICVIVANFVADLLYGIIDPRIKYG